MNKGQHRAYERRRRGALRAKGSRGRSKGKSKNEGSIMRSEVQRYKDAEKAVEAEEETSISNRRMTIQQGIYAHGRSSGNVQRGKLGMNAEAKARAEANLSDILALASHAPASKQKCATATASPLRFFLPKKGSGHPQQKENVSRTHSDDVSSQGTPVRASQVSRSSSDKGTRVDPSSHPEGTSQTKPHKKKDTVGGRKAETSRKHSAKPETKPAEIDRSMYEYLATSVNNGLEEKTPSTIDRSAEIIRKLHKKYEERLRERRQREQENSAKIKLTLKSRGALMRRPEVLRTPSCEDYLKTLWGQDTPRHFRSAGVQLNESVCPGTTIISPHGLLVRHEKLQAQASPQQAKGMAGRTGILHPSASLMECDISNVQISPQVLSASRVFENSFDDPNNETMKVVKEHLRPLCDKTNLQHSLEHKTPPPVSSNDSVPQCPKTVVADPLHYLERYEQQTSNFARSDAEEVRCEGDVFSGIYRKTHTLNRSRNTGSYKESYSHNGDLFIQPSKNTNTGQGDTHLKYKRSKNDYPAHHSYNHRHNWRRRDLGNFLSSEKQQMEGCSSMAGNNFHSTAQRGFTNIPQNQHPDLSVIPTSQMEEVFDSSVHKINLPGCQQKPLLQLTDPIFPSYPLDNTSMPPPTHTTQGPQVREAVKDIFKLSPMSPQTEERLQPEPNVVAFRSQCSIPLALSNSRFKKPHYTLKDPSRLQMFHQEMAHCIPMSEKRHMQHSRDIGKAMTFSDGAAVGECEGVICCRVCNPHTTMPVYSTAHNTHRCRCDNYMKAKSNHCNPHSVPQHQHSDLQHRGSQEWAEGIACAQCRLHHRS